MFRKSALILALLVVATTAQAQSRREGDRGGGDRGPRQATDYKQYDKNGDGLLDPEELPEIMRRFIGRTAERAGVDPTKPMSIEKLNAASAARAAESGGGPPGSAPPSNTPPAATPPANPAPPPTNDNSSKSNDKKPLVPGFGEKDTMGKVPGFEVPLPMNSNLPIEKVYDPRVVERVQRALRENDGNGDGILDADELKKSNWTNPPLEESDLNKDGKMSKQELAERYAKRYGWHDAPGAASAGKAPSADASKGDAAKPNADTSKFKGYAEGLFKQHDADKNGILDKEEWKNLKPEYHAADQNGDHVITLEELIYKVTEINNGGGTVGGTGGGDKGGDKGGRDKERDGGSRSASGGSSSGPNAKTIASAKKAGRFLTATERLPKGLPDWFIRNDADGDGQIGMAEYAASWSDTTAAEFEKYDVNGDGYITPEECLDVLKTTATTAKK